MYDFREWRRPKNLEVSQAVPAFAILEGGDRRRLRKNKEGVGHMAGLQDSPCLANAELVLRGNEAAGEVLIRALQRLRVAVQQGALPTASNGNPCK